MSVPFWLWWNTLIPPSGLKTAAWSVLGPQWWCSWFCIKGEYDQGKGGAPKPMSNKTRIQCWFSCSKISDTFVQHLQIRAWSKWQRDINVTRSILVITIIVTPATMATITTAINLKVRRLPPSPPPWPLKDQTRPEIVILSAFNIIVIVITIMRLLKLHQIIFL